MGVRPEEAGGAGALILPVAGEGVRRGWPLFDPGRGNREGGEGESGLGRGSGGGGPVWAWGSVQMGHGSSGGGRASPFLFLLCLFCFLFSFYLFIFFSVLFHLKVFRYFIKMCFLHHNYQCII